MFHFGIEHEVAFFSPDGFFADYVFPTSYAAFSHMIAQLPLYTTDYPQLLLGDAGIRVKRWYLEGLERFDKEGHLLTCLSKGIEIRTTIHSTIQGAVDELHASFQGLRKVATSAGFVPVLTSFNPYRTQFVPNPPFNPYEEGLLHLSPEDETALLSMLTYGPDLSFSLEGVSDEGLIDLGRKLTYYSPYIVPFTFSSPFYDGKLWDGLSVRTFLRTGLRPSVLVFLQHPPSLPVSNPSLVKRARIPAEIGRIEFKACDACEDFTLYTALLALLKGLALDTTLAGRATTPDPGLHQLSARHGFAHPMIADGSQTIVSAARRALVDDPDASLLDPLWKLLQTQETLAARLIRVYHATGSIEAALYQTYPEPLSGQ